MEKFLKILTAVMLMLLPFLLVAQDCNETYKQAVEMRKTMTIDAQNQAIYLFQQARDCFTEDPDIQRCNKQIALCVTVIKRLGGTPVLEHNAPVQASGPVEEPVEVPESPAELVQPLDTVAAAVESPTKVMPTEDPEVPEAPVAPVAEEEEDVTCQQPSGNSGMTIEQVIDFAAKNADAYSFAYDTADNVVVKFHPDWINVVLQDGKIVITAKDNDGDARTGTLLLQGNDVKYVFQITQKRKKGLFGL
ncbi:MAG: hypothetical protein NC405_05500 [Odoribacter sp.]|nr:hypothetical protein [Odoribacter sp.]